MDWLQTLICVTLLLLQTIPVSATRKYYMEDLCGEEILMEGDGIPAGRLSLTRRSKYRSTFSCTMTIVAPTDRKLIVVFRELDIELEPSCDDDFLQLFDGPDTHSARVKGLPARLCGYQRPIGSYVTSGRHLTLSFHSDIYKQEDGFQLIFTSYHAGVQSPCTKEEFRCENGRCIANSLKCDGFDNCGDDSDECGFSPDVILSVVVSVLLITIVGLGVIVVVRRRRRLSSSRKNKEAIQYAADKSVATITTIQRPPGWWNQPIRPGLPATLDGATTATPPADDMVSCPSGSRSDSVSSNTRHSV